MIGCIVFPIGKSNIIRWREAPFPCDWSNSFNMNVILEKDAPLFIDYLISDRQAILRIIRLIEQKCQNIELYSKFKWVANYLMTVTNDQKLINRLHEI